MFRILEELGYNPVWIPSDQYSEKQKIYFDRIASLHEKLFKRTFNRYQFLVKSFIASKQLTRALSKDQYDYIFAVGAINELAFLRTRIPIIYINDIINAQHIHYYPAYMGLGFYSKKILKFLEKKALDNCDAIILPSEWSVNCAEKLYHIPKEKLHLLRFGANMEIPDKAELQFTKNDDILKLLFLGVDWERKGGAIALQTAECLNDRGIHTELTVAGCVPPVKSTAMRVLPFLNKNKPDDAKKLSDLMRDSDMLFVPTRAECYGIVFCEASGYGLPSITTATGGVTSIVKDGINGYALPLNAKPEDYADTIQKLIENPERFTKICKTSRERYEAALSWEIWKKDLKTVLKTIQK